MPRADRKLFRRLNDDVSRDLLEHLLGKEGPRTQGQLAADLNLNSATVSRRLGHLEDDGVVERVGPRGPYSVVFPKKTRDLLQAATDLALLIATSQAESAKEQSDRFRSEGFAGGHLHDRVKEGG